MGGSGNFLTGAAVNAGVAAIIACRGGGKIRAPKAAEGRVAGIEIRARTGFSLM
jgi:hypothetical protein